jgi:DNA-binding MarR family transcriptional regulator/N-acetylglutamate synthase-like GNAT family acetyltransferase
MQADEGSGADPVDAVRRFNRFYTQQIGVLHEKLLRSPFSLTEARVLYEVAHQEKTTAKDLASELALDAGYLSRILQSFKKKGLIAKQMSKTDGRQSLLWLTDRGREIFATLNTRSQKEIEALLAKLTDTDQKRLIGAMNSIESILGAKPESKVPYILRQHQPGDMGWVVHRHGVLYAQEYGWDERFEALVAGIVTKFIENYDPKKERCWIAEMEGENVGSVFLVKKSKTVAQLRMLLVEPKARSVGLGTRLVEECIRFARQVGYRKIILWTNDVLHAARHIYEKFGFRLIREEPGHSFGRDQVFQTWELKL